MGIWHINSACMYLKYTLNLLVSGACIDCPSSCSPVEPQNPNYNWNWNHLHCIPKDPLSSATTLVSIRNTRVFRTSLTALMEHCTLWRRITRYPSPRRWVALHTNLLYCLVTYTHHQNDTCVTLFVVAAVMLKLFTQRLAMINARRCLCLSPAAASLAMLLVCLEIIATTYRSTIFKTYAFSLYSHLCIYVSI